MKDLKTVELRARQSRAGLRSCKWDEIYDSIEELRSDLMSIELYPKYGYQLPRGYEYLRSFKLAIEKGKKLSEAQEKQLKRLAPEVALTRIEWGK